MGARTVSWLLAAGLSALGLAGAPPAPLGLAWLALCAAPVGILLSGSGWAALVPVLVWGGVLGAQAPWAALVLTGYLAAGVAVGRLRPQTRVADAGWALLLAAMLTGLPSLAGLGGHAPWSPGVTARLLDLSPVVLLIESAGIDWLRHPAVYGPAGGDALGPELRGAWSGAVAGPGVLLLGCALFAASSRRRLLSPA